MRTAHAQADPRAKTESRHQNWDPYKSRREEFDGHSDILLFARTAVVFSSA